MFKDTLLEQQNWGEVIMQKHSQRHHALSPFSDLILWLKSTRPTVYQNVLERYKNASDALYRKEFDRFFNDLTQRANNLQLANLKSCSIAKIIYYISF